MPFLQAVFCFKGFDDRSRFFAISMVTLLGFVFFSTLFSQYFTINLIALLLLATVLTASSTRRLHDAQLSKNWYLVPGILFVLTGLISLNIDNSSSFYLLVLPLVSIALLLTYPSKAIAPQGKYIFGYFGPVNLSRYIQKPVTLMSHNQRIEPTLIADGVSEHLPTNEHTAEQNISINNSSSYSSYGTDNTEQADQADIGELIRLKLLNNRKFQIAIIASIVLILVSVFVHSAINDVAKDDPKSIIDTANQQATPGTNQNIAITERNHSLTMPDDFTLYLSKYNGVTLHWQADQVKNGELWSQISATGDKSCQDMSFNKGASIRPLAVSIEGGNEYFANFSPLDSTALIQALAFRGNFELCGYSFSLKGTQALLGKHSQYAPFLDSNG